MIDSSLASALIDGGLQHRILGKDLLPFSLWHRFLLKTADSPFLRKGQVHLFDIRTAVGICQLRPFDSKVVRPTVFIPHWTRAQRLKWLAHKRDQLLDYFGDYLTKPEWSIVPPSSHGKLLPPPPSRTPIPEEMQVAGDVIGWSGWSLETIFALPIAKAYWCQMMAQRDKGLDIDFLSDEERQFQADKKAAEAKDNGEQRTQTIP